MTERSSSHKSDGRQSSAGQSVQSARAGSFGFESRPLSATVPPFIPMGPPPGLFILGPVPSIIRCWLDTRFSNESLLYAAVCTGSFRSVIGMRMVDNLGLRDQINTSREGQRTIKIPMYLPEATIQLASSRSSSPVPQLPTLTIDFTVHESPAEDDAIQIFLGCDTLRARNADIHFSLDRLTLFDDERNKLSVPLVRPENTAIFQNLQITNNLRESSANPSSAKEELRDSEVLGSSKVVTDPPRLETKGVTNSVATTKLGESSVDVPVPSAATPSVIGQGRQSLSKSIAIEKPLANNTDSDPKGSEDLANGSTPDTPTRLENGNVWGSWRRDSQSGRQDALSSTANSSAGYQRAGRGRGMKVLKLARVNTTRSGSMTQPPSNSDGPLGRSGEAGKWGSPSGPNDNQELRTSAIDRRYSGGAKSPLQNLSAKPTKSNPVGGASAFGWLNSSQPKQPESNHE